METMSGRAASCGVTVLTALAALTLPVAGQDHGHGGPEGWRQPEWGAVFDGGPFRLPRDREGEAPDAGLDVTGLPDATARQVRLGFARLAEGESAEAERYFRRALTESPDCALAMVGTALACEDWPGRAAVFLRRAAAVEAEGSAARQWAEALLPAVEDFTPARNLGTLPGRMLVLTGPPPVLSAAERTRRWTAGLESGVAAQPGNAAARAVLAAYLVSLTDSDTATRRRAAELIAPLTGPGEMLRWWTDLPGPRPVPCGAGSAGRAGTIAEEARAYALAARWYEQAAAWQEANAEQSWGGRFARTAAAPWQAAALRARGLALGQELADAATGGRRARKWPAFPDPPAVPARRLTGPPPRTGNAAVDAHRGRPGLAVFFLGTGCAHCLRQLEALKPLAPALAADGVPVWSVSIDERAAATRTFGAVAAPFPVLADPDHAAFAAWAVQDEFTGYPLHGTVLLGPDGAVLWRVTGGEPFMDVEALPALWRVQAPAGASDR